MRDSIVIVDDEAGAGTITQDKYCFESFWFC